LPASAVSCLLCLQDLLAPVFIGLQVLLLAKNVLFLAFYRPVKAICAIKRLKKAVFCLLLPIIFASRPMDMCASSSCIDSASELIEICRRLLTLFHASKNLL
jgi:hypothetical protein